MRKIILALIMVMAAASFAVADTIYLRDGRTINGTLLGFINGRFVVRVEPRYSTLPSATTDSKLRGGGPTRARFSTSVRRKSSASRLKAARSKIRALRPAPCR